VQIYLPSTEGSGLTSKYGATIKDTLNWYGFVDMGNISKMRLLRQGEWRSIGRNSNTGTNIAGSADPVTTGGHSDTAGRRMISDIGVEDVAGCIWQWIADVGNADSGIKQLIAGGSWDTGTNAGLNNINGLYANGSAQAFISARFCCEGI
jgi:hypothetical protein